MISVKEVIVVEGRYDKNTLSQVFDAVIVETSGFGLFKDGEKLALLRRLAEKRGLVVLTDSDGAGFVIRNHIKSAIPGKYLKHAYIPDIPGKERRKSAPGREGKLGVEGMTPEVILAALRNAGATIEGGKTTSSGGITKQDLMALGLSGGSNAGEKRKALLKKLNLIETERDSTDVEFDIYQGRRVTVDDGCPVADNVYTTYLFGNGAVAYGNGSPVGHVATEVDRDKQTGGGVDYLINRKAFILHPRGIAYTGAKREHVETPTRAELAMAENWKPVYEPKQLRIVAIKHKIG